jgi:hypothetical protein
VIGHEQAIRELHLEIDHMDANRLAALLSSWRGGPTRRGLGRSLGGIALAAPLMPLLGLTDAETKKKRKKKKKCKGGKKKCGKKCILKSSCCVNGTEFPDGAVCGDACTLCQSGVCASQCTSGETCLANGSCGTTCENDGQCNMGACSCNAEEGGDPVCRVPSNGGSDCTPLSPCTTTADCPQDTVCSSICNPSRCVPLC